MLASLPPKGSLNRWNGIILSKITKKLVFSALKNKKHVITANKALVAKYGDQLAKIAEKNISNLVNSFLVIKYKDNITKIIGNISISACIEKNPTQGENAKNNCPTKAVLGLTTFLKI